MSLGISRGAFTSARKGSPPRTPTHRQLGQPAKADSGHPAPDVWAGQPHHTRAINPTHAVGCAESEPHRVSEGGQLNSRRQTGTGRELASRTIRSG